MTVLKHLGKCLLLFVSFTLSNPGEVWESYNEVHDRKYYEQRGDILWEVPVHKKMIALTFDDGPHPKITPQILDLLNQYEAKATFFVVGNRIDKNTDIILREIRACLRTPKTAHFAEFSFHARRVWEGVPGVGLRKRNEAGGEKAVKGASERVFRHALMKDMRLK